MTYEEARKEAEQILKGAEVPDAALDAWYLLEYAIRKIEKKETGRTWYLMNRKESILPGTLLYYQELVSRRKQRIPLQHLTGEQEFMGLTFKVNEHVLIPRQDTEVLVEEALNYVRSGMDILDVCTGSGCILLSVLKLGEKKCRGIFHGTGVDLSREALQVAEENAGRLQVEATFLHSDLFAEVQGQYDMILSNPPYIEKAVVETLEEEVRIHEPRMALDGGEDGLDFYRKITAESVQYLRKGGRLLFEIGYDQGEAVSALMKEHFAEVRVIQDLAGLDRVVCGMYNKRVVENSSRTKM